MTFDGYTMNPVEVAVSRQPQSFSQPIDPAARAEAASFAWKDVPSTLFGLFGGGGSALSSSFGLGPGGATSTVSTDFKANQSTSVQGAVKNSVAGNTSIVIQTGKGSKTSTVDQRSEPNVGNLTSPLDALKGASGLAWLAVLAAAGLLVWFVVRK